MCFVGVVLMLTYFYALFNDGVYLAKTTFPLKYKVKVLLKFTKIWVKKNLGVKNFGREKIMGVSFTTPSYTLFSDMFRETFVHNNYYVNLNKKSPLIIDCGANIGVSIAFFKHMYPKSKVYGYEPDPTTYSYLSRNVGNLDNVTLYNEAVGNAEGSISFWVSNDTSSLGMSIFKREDSSTKISVKISRLSERITTDVDILKMDIEGSESDVLADLIRTKKIAKIKNMIIEYHHHMTGPKTTLSKFLENLESSGFDYQLDSKNVPVSSKNTFQDVLIYAYRKK